MARNIPTFSDGPIHLPYPASIDLSIVIVNYNTRDLTLTCLESVYTHTQDLSFEIFLVDNASEDGSANTIAERYPDIHVIRNSTNLGFSVGNNQGIRKSRGHYIVLLNSDARLRENSFQTIVHYLNNNSEVGIATPKVVGQNGVVASMRFREDTPWDACMRILGRYNERRELEMMEEEKIREVESIGGPCFFIRRTLIESIGLLDEIYFLYNEEDDFCRRALRHRRKVVYFPKTTIVHLRGKTTHLPEMRERVIIETYRSNLYFYSKHYSLGWNLVLRVLYRVTFVLGLLKSSFRHLTGKSSQSADDSLRLKIKLLFLETPPL